MLEKFLEDLCRFDTTSGKENKMLGYLNKILEKANFKVSHQKVFGSAYNIIAERGTGGIWFIAHMDVYPQYDRARYKRSKDVFYGRGVVDVKGQIASLLDAVTKTDEPVQISFVVDEELGGRGSEILKVPDKILGAVVLEPTNLKLGICEAGSLTIEVGFRGDTAHGATPWRGVSAIEMAMEAYFNLQKQPFMDHKHPLFEKGAWTNIGKIIGGLDTMLVAPYCTMEIEIGFAPGLCTDILIPQVQSAFEKADYVHFIDISEPWETKKEELIVQLISNVYQKTVGKNIEFCGMSAWTDASNIYQKNVPVVVFGAGDLSLAHTSKEKIDLGSLKTLSNTLRNLIRSSF